MPLVLPFETSFGRMTQRECVLVSMKNEKGLTGYGECVAWRDPGYSYETAGTALHILKEFVVPLLLGQDLGSAADFNRLVSGIRGHHMAKAGVEMALWDLFGKQDGKPLAQMLGGKLKKVEVGVSIGLQDSPEALAELAGSYVEQGYTRVKIKIKPGRDIGDTTAVRAAFPNLRLQVDANSAYSLETAEKLKPLDDLNLLLIEQPLSDDDIWDHHKLQKILKTPICLDESIHSVRHVRYALEMKACRIINIKAGRVGGLAQSVEIHDLCLANRIPVWCGGMMETNVGRAANLALASLPGFTLPGDISASDRYYRRDITHETFVLNPDSTIAVPAGVGLGVTVDEKALSDFTLSRIDFKADGVGR